MSYCSFRPRHYMLSVLAFAIGSQFAFPTCFGSLSPGTFRGRPSSALSVVDEQPRINNRIHGKALFENADVALPLGVMLGSAASIFCRRFMSQRSRIARSALEHGEDLSVSGDAFVVLGVAHVFEQGDRKLQDVWVLEPVSASTVEVINNGAQTSYEALIGTTVSKILAKDTSVFPEELFCGHEVRWADKLEFRTGCAARTWMRDHARDVVRNIVPFGEVVTGFNVSTQHKRILNFVHVVKDSDNIKQDMSIDVYGRAEDEEKEQSQIAEMYNM